MMAKPMVTDSPPRSKGVPDLLPLAADCLYTPYFCEENIWKLCEFIHKHKPNILSSCYVVFISNKKKTVPLWRQKAGREEDKLVVWDYHVIFLYWLGDGCVVYDLDSQLPFPTYFQKYVTETFRTDGILNADLHRFFRVIPAPLFYQTFSSDRSHMRRSDGSWLNPPPSYPPIYSPAIGNNMGDFMNMDVGVGPGTVMGLTDFVRRFFPACRSK